MMYITTHLNTYSPKNKACAELSEWIEQFKHIIIKDETSLDALKEEIHHKVADINARYPKVRPISVASSHEQIRAKIMTSCGVPDEVFILSVAKVRSVYEFSESVPVVHHPIKTKKGGTL